jgi:predicted dehydrogenase
MKKTKPSSTAHHPSPEDDIRGVVIATPAETHFNIARESLFAGKHVFV